MLDGLPMIAVIFSKDRPLQLDATLRSFALHCHDAARVPLRVLYAASSPSQLSLYRQVMREHPAATFILEQDFKRDLLSLIHDAAHILFVVDDCLFIRGFSMAEIIKALDDHPDALGFSLRLGRNTTYCYPQDRQQQLPQFQGTESLLKYMWPQADCDFGYPLELSSSLYRAAQVAPLLTRLDYKNPNKLEAAISRNAENFKESHPFLLCSPHSLAFCAPINKVQKVWRNRAGDRADCSPEILAQEFAAGQRVAVENYSEFSPNACHQEVEFKLARTGPAIPWNTPKKVGKLRRLFSPAPFLSDYLAFRRLCGEKPRQSLHWKDFHPCLFDRTAATNFDRHYVYHPAWAARVLARMRPAQHVDISSTLHFCALASAFVPVKFYDYRPADLRLDDLSCERADLLALPFADASIPSLSCMHVVEHIGLGRYGDPLDPDGDLKAMRELERVLAPGGTLLFVVPIGQPRICFNAHRIYAPEQIVKAFPKLDLKEFTLIPEDAQDGGLVVDPPAELIERQRYGCGCFRFER